MGAASTSIDGFARHEIAEALRGELIVTSLNAARTEGACASEVNSASLSNSSRSRLLKLSIGTIFFCLCIC